MNRERQTIRIENLSTGYRNRKTVMKVNEGISLSAAKGKLIFLTGPNGSGKTTLLKTITGTLRPLKGSIFIKEREITSLRGNAISKIVSVVLTSIPDPGYLTVEEIVTLGRAPYTGFKNRLTEDDNKIIEKSIEMLSLSPLGKRLFSELSDGEKQKTMIARALCQNTDIICMDEPSSHLDFPSRIELISFLKTIAEKENKTVIISSHDLNTALNSADIIWLIEKSNTIHSGAPEDLALSGIIGKVFNRGNFRFSEKTGEFLSESSFSKTITADGPEEAVFWTGKALRKEGLRISHNTEYSGPPEEIKDLLTVRSSGKSYVWSYKKRVFRSIYEVVCFIKQQQGLQ